MIDVSDRHSSVQAIVRLLDSQHLDPELRPISQAFEQAASTLLVLLPDGPRLTAALEGLWHAKNDAVGHTVGQRPAPPITHQPGDTISY